jgi:hypothetical protein
MYNALSPDCGDGEVAGDGTHPTASNPAARSEATRIEGMEGMEGIEDIEGMEDIAGIVYIR